MGDLIISPEPEETQYSTSALDLRVGHKFWKFKDIPEGFEYTVDYDLLRKTPESYKKIMEHIESVQCENDGAMILRQNGFLLMETYEKIRLPLDGQLAARVEGRSSLARLGISVHMTAPTVHCGFSGPVYLELKNEGPFHLKIWPGKTRICQMVFERVSSRPVDDLDTIFMEQETPTGKA